MTQELDYTSEVAKATAPIYDLLKDQLDDSYWETIAPYIFEINRLKKEKNAVILAHNYMTPDIFHGVGDFIGDSLGLAREAQKTDADIIIQGGVNFMAETSKILCPDKTVLIPDIKAGCSLADAITAEDVRKMKADNPGVPVVTYINTTAEVKAESDVCCTSANALKIVEALGREGHKRVIMTPDMFLAQNTAAQTDIEVIYWEGTCVVHEKFTAKEVDKIRASNADVVVLAHPECPPEVLDAADYAGSTAQMDDYIKKHQPKNAVLMTECSMSDNIAAANPKVNMIGTCQMCPYMKMITLPKILTSLQEMKHEVIVDPELAERALKPIKRMLDMS